MPNRLRPAALGALLASLSLTALAVTPLTPRLDDPTRLALLADLTRLGLPEPAQNSVVLGLAGVLGFEPRAGQVAHERAAPHLPRVAAQATPAGAGCARVDAEVTHGDERPLRLRVQGTYCLVGTAVWHADDQRVSRLSAAP